MEGRDEAADASTRVAEALSGVGDEMADTSRALERSRERTEEMEARAEAMAELSETGAFDDMLSDEDELDRELRETTTDSEVEAELDTLRAEMGGSGGAGESSGSKESTSETADPAVEAELEELRDDEGN
jgi:phage shock protein A